MAEKPDPKTPDPAAPPVVVKPATATPTPAPSPVVPAQAAPPPPPPVRPLIDRPMHWTRCHGCKTVTTAVWAKARHEFLYGRHTLPPADPGGRWVPPRRCAMSHTAIQGAAFKSQAEVPALPVAQS